MRLVAAVLAISVLPACTPLRPLDPAGDAGRAADAAISRDARVLDAPGPDAPGLDASSAPDATAARDAWVPMEDGGCVAPPRCEGSTLITCVAGVARPTPCELGCLSEPDVDAHCAELVPSNIPVSLFAEATRSLEVTSDAFLIDTDACTIAGASRVVMQTGGGEVCALLLRELQISDRSTVRVTGARPLVIAVDGPVTIGGILDLSAVDTDAGPGGGRGATESSAATGPAPGLAGTHVATYPDGGGGGGGACGAGGGGGSSESGMGEIAVGGAGGAARMTTLEPLVGGSGGGAGATGLNSGLGGAGGGALQITARTSITLTGQILAGGGAGLAGAERTGAGAGGGGGSGGSVLLEAPRLELAPGAGVLATGGGGGAGADTVFRATRAEDGGGLERRARGGESRMYGSNGGDSGAVATPDGLPGADNPANGNAGGGGGGVGCIVLRAMTPPSTGGARLSPSATGLSILPLRTR